MSDTTTAGATPVTNPADGATPAANPTPDGATPDGNAADVPFEQLPESWQKHIAELRKENIKRRQQADTERQQAEEKRLAEQQKWQELAAKREQERDELKPYRERYEALAAQQRAALTAETAKWPAEVRALLPAEDADVQVYADAVTKARALVAALAAKTDAATGHGTTPPPAGGAGGGQDKAAARASFERLIRSF